MDEIIDEIGRIASVILFINLSKVSVC